MTERVSFEQGFEGGRGGNHVAIWAKDIPGRGNQSKEAPCLAVSRDGKARKSMSDCIKGFPAPGGGQRGTAPGVLAVISSL